MECKLKVNVSYMNDECTAHKFEKESDSNLAIILFKVCEINQMYQWTKQN